MKIISLIFGLFFMLPCIAQESKNKTIDTAYETFLSRVGKDTLVTYRSKEYKCSEDVFGIVGFYYEKEKLRLIEHTYKQGFYEDYTTEYYFMENDDLVMSCMLFKISHLNTYSYESKYQQKAGVEKVLELVEERMFFDKDTPVCYRRSYGTKVSEWDQDYFNSLDFEASNCNENVEDIRYKYRLLRKAEKRLLHTFRKGPACIFHMW
ncbi:hypothetical protein [Aquimarina sp. 2201CG5-10]|uniref:hypothetical protein n=1 Tax=Aquimarina callyspongiae TaxID=3098150 RepID=UPI002AB50D33|nr:hypothetical protein [Aquimarina sp. 2201CG5-10]MDY8137997.1 hypothetical protein [Aquimarina sp. 2201CG5-10]